AECRLQPAPSYCPYPDAGPSQRANRPGIHTYHRKGRPGHGSTRRRLPPRTSTKWIDSNMAKYVALLRAVNVGGTGKLPMATLQAMCIDAGFTGVKTYIASGNVVFASPAKPARVKAELEARLF